MHDSFDTNPITYLRQTTLQVQSGSKQSSYFGQITGRTVYNSTIYVLKASLTASEKDVVLSISDDGTSIYNLPI